MRSAERGVTIPPDWVCAFVACSQRADQPHIDDCPYYDESWRP